MNQTSSSLKIKGPSLEITSKVPLNRKCIKGNPWVLYGEPGNIGRPFLVEEGKYSSLESFPQNIEVTFSSFIILYV